MRRAASVELLFKKKARPITTSNATMHSNIIATMIKYCLDESECPFETHPNLIYSKKECIPGECPSNLWSFSNICYEKCPSGKVEKVKDNKNI